jgi:hypothetical protein
MSKAGYNISELLDVKRKRDACKNVNLIHHGTTIQLEKQS